MSAQIIPATTGARSQGRIRRPRNRPRSWARSGRGAGARGRARSRGELMMLPRRKRSVCQAACQKAGLSTRAAEFPSLDPQPVVADGDLEEAHPDDLGAGVRPGARPAGRGQARGTHTPAHPGGRRDVFRRSWVRCIGGPASSRRRLWGVDAGDRGARYFWILGQDLVPLCRRRRRGPAGPLLLGGHSGSRRSRPWSSWTAFGIPRLALGVGEEHLLNEDLDQLPSRRTPARPRPSGLGSPETPRPQLDSNRAGQPTA